MNAKNVKLLFGDNKCIHRCHSQGHIVEIHTKGETDVCDRIEQTWTCRECDWASTGMDHIRGTIR